MISYLPQMNTDRHRQMNSMINVQRAPRSPRRPSLRLRPPRDDGGNGAPFLSLRGATQRSNLKQGRPLAATDTGWITRATHEYANGAMAYSPQMNTDARRYNKIHQTQNTISGRPFTAGKDRGAARYDNDSAD